MPIRKAAGISPVRHGSKARAHSKARMNSDAARQPRFEKPPVVEVALSAQFKPLPELGIPQLGALWSSFRDRFPRYEHQAPLSHEIERKGVRQIGAGLEISLLRGPQLAPRLWMLNERGTELLQVQHDRFVRNWRRNELDDVVYPEYDRELRSSFQRDFQQFAAVIANHGVGDPELDQCEVTYVNHIHGDGVWTSHSEVARVFRLFSPEYPHFIRCETEGIGLRARFPLDAEDGEFLGRFFVQIDSALRRVRPSETGETVPIFVLTFVARGRPLGPGLAGLMSFLDLGHAAIVSMFEKITTPEMHRAWGRVT